MRSQWQQLRWMLWKNMRLKVRNWKSTMKEIGFPIYTFMLISLLKFSTNLSSSEEIHRWPARPIPRLEKTGAAWVCEDAWTRGLAAREPGVSGVEMGTGSRFTEPGVLKVSDGPGLLGVTEGLKKLLGFESQFGSLGHGAEGAEGAKGVREAGVLSAKEAEGLVLHGVEGQRAKEDKNQGDWGSGDQGDEDPCLLLLSPSTSPTVQRVAEFVRTRLDGTFIGVKLMGNKTETKRYHLDHAGHVLAGVHLEDSGDCSQRKGSNAGGETAENCEIEMELRLNNTNLMEVRAGFSAEAEMHVGILSLQELMQHSILDATYHSSVPAYAGRVNLWFHPFPTSGDPMAITGSESRISLITSLYFVAAWIPSMQILLVNIVMEKKMKLRDVMRCMGLKDLVFWLSWLGSELCVFATALVPVIIFGSYSGLFADCDLSLVYLIFILFVASVTTLSFLISVFFQNPKVAGGVGSALMAGFSFCFSLMRVLEVPREMFWFFSLLSPVAMSSAGTSIWKSEVRWSGLSSGPNPLWGILLVLLIDTIIYFVLALYFERAFSGERWDLCFCVPERVRRMIRPRPRDEVADDIPLLDLEPELERKSDLEAEGLPAAEGSGGGDQRRVGGAEGLRAKPAVLIRSIRKMFRESNQSLVALDGISLDLFEDQVFALLGPNGAGKSTLISILTGISQPTSGYASVFGLDLDDKWNLMTLRESMGYCPQEDVLLEDLTVREHLRFFAGLKGLGPEAVELEASARMREMDLQSHENVQVKNLSGGLKRRLSVALAVTGDPSFIVLDEPSSGMDAQSRKALWGMLGKLKKEKVIIVSTHSMEEADALADRIGILVHGTLKANGEPLQLKNRYGLGYKLHCVRATATSDKPSDPRAEAVELTGWITQRLPSARIVSTTSSEIAFELGEPNSSEFPALLAELDASLSSLNLSGYGLTSTSLEEVFLRICEGVEEDWADSSSMELSTNFGNRGESLQPLAPIRYFRGVRAVAAQVWKLSICRFRDKRALAHFLLYPVVMIVFTFSIFTSSYFTFGKTMMLRGDTLSPSALWPPKVSLPVFAGAGINAEEFINQFVGSIEGSRPWQSIPTRKDFMEKLTEPLVTEGLGGGYPAGLEVWTLNPNSAPGEITVHYNSSMRMSASAFQASLYNTSAQMATLQGLAPPVTLRTKVLAMPGKSATAQPQSFILAFMMSIALLHPVSFIAEDIVSERERRLKHLLHVLGARSLDYWLAHWGADILIFILPVLVALISGKVAGSPAFLSPVDLVSTLLLVLFVIGLCGFVYPITFFFSDSKTVLKWISSILLLATSIPLSLMFTVSVTYPQAAENLSVFFSFFPALSFSWGFFRVSGRAILNKELERESSIHDLLYGAAGAFKQIRYLIYGSLFYFVVAVILDLRRYRYIKQHVHVPGEVEAKDDPDVAAEREKIEAHGRGGCAHLCAHYLRKVYGYGMGAKVAVKSLSFEAHQGECFSLLGPNGAGKTSTMLMLSGEVKPDGGQGILGGFSVYKDILRVFPILGICPQSDTLWETLTAREHLELGCALRGISQSESRGVVSQLLNDLVLEEWADKTVQTFSGGNKRKLAVAMSLIGSPSIVLLDEPSTGMDPISKKKMWELIRSERRGRVLLLTTHSMAEAEALSTRIGIMRGGELRCIGSAQHLKSRFGRGLHLQIKAPGGQLQDLKSLLNEVLGGKAAVHQTGSGEELGGDLFQFHIQRLEGGKGTEGVGEEGTLYPLPLAALFQALESNKERLQIHNYCISQASLEQVFLSISGEDQDSEPLNPQP